MANPQNAEVFSGEDFTLTVSLTDSDGTALTSSEVDAINEYRYIVSSGPYASSNLISKTIGSGVTLSNTAITATIAVGDTDTDSMDGTYYHEAKATDNSNNETTSFIGKLTVRRNVL